MPGVETRREESTRHVESKPRPQDDAERPMASIAEVLSFAKKNSTWLQMLAAFILSIISGLVLPLWVFLFAEVFSDLSAPPTSPDFMKNIREVTYQFLVLGAIGFVSMTFQTTLMETVAGEMTGELKRSWFGALLRQDMAYYDINDAKGQASIISNNGRQYRKGVGRKLAEGVQFFVAFLGGLVYAFWAAWQTSLLVLATIPFMTIAVYYSIKIISTTTARKNESYKKVGSIVNMSVSSIRTILSLNAVQTVIDMFESATEEALRGAASQAHFLGLAYGGQMASFILAYIPIILYGGYLLYNGVRDTGCDPSAGVPGNEACTPSGADMFGSVMGITISASVLPQVSVAIEAFSGARAACFPALAAMRRTLENDTPGAVTNKETKTKGDVTAVRRGSMALPPYTIDSSSESGIKPATVNGNIQFNNVGFAYPTRQEDNVFDGFTLNIEAGKHVALVGGSGSGKSTAVQLIERFYDPTAGSVTLDGHDLKHLNVKWLRQQIGLVNQEPSLFPTTITENIKIACPNATQKEIEEVAKTANAHDFIVSLQDGYETQVGDEGSQLSGGQKQRISIARVLLEKPKILLLDEATSALDSESEALVQEALDKLMALGNTTVIVIAHRLATIRMADMIAVVDQGKVVETGSHAELLGKRGKYFELVEAQKGNNADEENHGGQKDGSDVSSSTPPSRMSTRTSSDEALESTGTTTLAAIPILSFEHVDFFYPTRPDNMIFQNLNLNVYEGETLAICGPSGQGKSTIIQMIEQFYHPTAGCLYYKGIDMKEMNVHWIREQISLVGQEPDVFDMPIKDNIKFGYPKATQLDINSAARKANAFDFIMSFPDKYDTQMGDAGSQVSGGQKQRIALARALIRKPKILLLDEATSALDSESERIVQEALYGVMADRSITTIVIAHRLSTIRNADRIAVVNHGRVREIGTHEELMAISDGHYRRLQSLQNLDAERPKETEKPNKLQAVKELDNDRPISVEDFQKAGEKPIDSALVKANANRARLLGRSDWPYLVIGGVGAIMAGIFFPAYGIVSAKLVEVLYYPLRSCDPGADCREDRFDAAEELRSDSLLVFYYVLAIMVLTLIGNVLLFYGFGVATERMNKRVRDAAFKSLVRQEIAWYDMRTVGSITSQLAEDAAMLHAFAGEPIRTMAICISSVLVGLVISFIYMWPFALLTLAILPFMSFGAEAEMKTYMGEDEGDGSEENKQSSSKIAIESIQNIRTVAALTLEQQRSLEYSEALQDEDPTPVRSNFVKGVTGGLGQFLQFWGMALMFWWGGWLLANYHDVFSYNDYLVSLFSLLFCLYGLAIAFEGMTDRDKAKKAAARIFALVDRESLIDPLSEDGQVFC